MNTLESPSRRRARRWIAPAVLALIAFLVVIVIVVPDGPTGGSGAAGGSTPPGIPPTSSAPADAPARDLDETTGSAPPEEAESLVSRFVALTADTPAGQDLEEIAAGELLDEVEADSLELEANGWSRSGAPAVVWIRPASMPGLPDGAIAVEACLDSSAVTVEAAGGGEVIANPATRAINVFTLAPVDGALRLISRSFPDDPAC